MPIAFYQWSVGVWVVIAAFWLLEAVRGKRTVRREPLFDRVLHLSLMAPAFALLFSSVAARVGFLRVRVLPALVWIGWVGLGLTVAGCTLAVWARVMLGSNWSGTVTLKRDHELIRTGPYAVVRHPIYSGFLLAMLGTGLALGEARGIVAFALAFIGWFVKARREERFLAEQFGEDYMRYCREVRRLVPFIL
jgi:protein-S-isoprenylcysteine O-methyltransferase Ste14